MTWPSSGHPARRGLDLDDDQRPAAILLAFYVLVGEQRGVASRSSRARSRPTSSGSTSPRRSGASRSSRRCAWSPTWSSTAPTTCRAGIDLDLRVPILRGRGDRRAGTRLHPGTVHLRRTGDRGAASTWDALRRGSFFFNAHIDFFEIASMRAPAGSGPRAQGRLTERGEARVDAASFHTQTAGVSLTAQQPMNNIVRTAIEGPGRCWRHPVTSHQLLRQRPSPSSRPRKRSRSLRTQQIIADETGSPTRPIRSESSYFVESLTDELEADAYDYFRRIDELGGMVEAVRQELPQREIGEAAFDFQRRVDDGEFTIVGSIST